MKMRRFLIGVVLLAALMSASCASMGSKKLVSSHTAYNDAVQLTITREVLTNIVRARYSDPQQFMRVNSINAQFSVSSGGSANVGGIGAAGSAGQLGGTIGYSDSPTITYIPQNDAGFYKSTMSAFAIGEAVGFGLQYRFAQLDRNLLALSLRLSFGSINRANDFVAGEYNFTYEQRVEAIARLLELGGTYRQVSEWDFDTISIPKDKVSAEDMVDAFGGGMSFIEEDGGRSVRLARYRLVLALVLPAPDDPEVVKALEILGVTPGRSKYVFRPPLHQVPDDEDSYSIWVTPRSMLDMISVASRFVDVPSEHSGIAPTLEPWHGDSTGSPPVMVRSSSQRPDVPYRVQHRGYWFYIDDTDLNSKMFLEAMVAAYTSRVGSMEATQDTPQVVLPVGG